jgi:mono/diheme cytochrome c family protein
LAQTVDVEVADIQVPDGSGSAIERGKYLVDHLMGCKECHGGDLGGKAVMDDGAMGVWYAPNLTKGNGSSVAEYSSRDWMRALRHGVGKDGRRLLLMPSEDFVNFGDEDMGAVVAYIRSLPSVDRENRGTSLGPIGKVLVATGQIQFAFDKIDHRAARLEAKPGPTKEWGTVLIGSCTGCHGTGLSGGKIPGGDPKWPEAANISPDKETGIGSWSYEDFVRAMREGKRKDGSAINEPMPWKAYAGLKDDDLKALWEYLKAASPKAKGGR